MRFQFLQSLIKTKAEENSTLGFGNFDMPSLKKIRAYFPFNSKYILLANVIRLNQDEKILSFTEKNWFELMCEDETDLDEFKF